jgi:signal peptidase I
VFKSLNKPEKEKAGNRWSSNGTARFLGVLPYVGMFIMAGVFAFLIITFVFRSYAVDGISMLPTLQNQDKLIIWKVPRTWASITGHQYVPKRGDIIVFNEPNLSACSQSTPKQLIKRVIGLPGNKVVIKNGAVTIYDKNHPNGFKPDQQLGYNKAHFIAYTGPTETIQLNSHQLFVLGDNRPLSCDSRYFGPINTNQVVGELVMRILPLSQVKLF